MRVRKGRRRDDNRGKDCRGSGGERGETQRHEHHAPRSCPSPSVPLCARKGEREGVGVAARVKERVEKEGGARAGADKDTHPQT